MKRLHNFMADARDLIAAVAAFLLWVPLGMAVSAILRGLETHKEDNKS